MFATALVCAYIPVVPSTATALNARIVFVSVFIVVSPFPFFLKFLSCGTPYTKARAAPNRRDPDSFAQGIEMSHN
jgi:hypothetical protein